MMPQPFNGLQTRHVLSVALVTALLLVLCSRSDVTAWAPVAQAASITTGEPALDGPLAVSASETVGATAAARTEARQRPLFNLQQLRAIWVDAFNPGIKTPREVDQLIERMHAARVNAIFAQVRKRGDAYFNRSIEPRADDLNEAPGNYDPLAYLIEKAHAATPPIEVHAWLNALPVAKASEPPTDTLHVYSAHGTNAPDADNWLSKNVNGALASDNLYFLDPGHPQADQYTSDVIVNLVKNYDVDGIHLDFIRYSGVQWGYNDVSVSRFNAATSTAGAPSPKDPRWMQWRRDQLSNLVRQIYLETIALKPQMKVSAALITWGRGPANDDDWRNMSAYNDVLQDWQAWLQEGTLDLAVPMNYDNEQKPQQRQWFDQWIEFEKAHRYQRQLAIGLGVFMNDLPGSDAQLRRAMAPGITGQVAQGVSFFSYTFTDAGDHNYDQFAQTLTTSTDAQATSMPLPGFADWARIPDMPWKTRPTMGYLKGYAHLSDGHAADGYAVQLSGPASRTLTTSGTGFYGALNLPPGTYNVSLLQDGAHIASGRVSVAPGRVSALDLNVSDRNEP